MELRIWIGLLGFALVLPASFAQDATAVYRKVSGAVFLVKVKNTLHEAQGSAVAFFNHIDPESRKPSSTWFATNHHVVGCVLSPADS